jgi:HPt (histidine-containing phosphotransfer) domain-containing protein
VTDFEQRMEALRGQFRARLVSDRMVLAAALSGGARDALRRAAHGLAGSAGVFGFTEIGASAQRVEQAVDDQADSVAITAVTEDLLARIDAELSSSGT